MGSPDAAALSRVIAARRDIRRFRADPVAPALLRSLLDAAHQAPSVGHSQPWRFVVVRDPDTRQRAANLADRARLAQAAALDELSGRQLLDLDLEGIREAPVGIVVCCDRRAPAAGVLGRATLPDADVWSCACAIENLWLAARAAGLGVGWVTLFHPEDLTNLVGAPDGVISLGWLCVGWPDERPPAPGLERRGWSQRLALADVVLDERWPRADAGAPSPPVSRLRPPLATSLVAARDQADQLLAPPGALGVLDRAVDRVLALGPRPESRRGDRAAPRLGGILVLAAADHPVAARGVSAYRAEVTRHVVEAALAGISLGALAAARAGLDLVVVDAGIGGPPLAAASGGLRRHRPVEDRGDLVTGDALTAADVTRLVSAGRALGAEVAAAARAGDGARVPLVALGEVGVANTTVAAALSAVLLDLPAPEVVGLGSGADRAIMDRKVEVVAAVRRRWAERPGARSVDPWVAMAVAGGPEMAVLAGVCLGAAQAGAAVVLDGLATSVAALAAVMAEPAVAAHLVGGQRSRERAHGLVLAALGLEPLLDLRLRAGEGVGACLAAALLAAAVSIRAGAATTV
jgi:nicotinate-nucleotide--dimethylbenzimidazole phosphoribosyltransferase